MNAEQIMKIFADTAYIRTGGSRRSCARHSICRIRLPGWG